MRPINFSWLQFSCEAPSARLRRSPFLSREGSFDEAAWYNLGKFLFLVRNIVFLNYIKQSRSTPDQVILLRQNKTPPPQNDSYDWAGTFELRKNHCVQKQVPPNPRNQICAHPIIFGSELDEVCHHKTFIAKCWDEKSWNILSDLCNPFFSAQAALNFLSPLRACLRAWLCGFCFLTSIRQRYFWSQAHSKPLFQCSMIKAVTKRTVIPHNTYGSHSSLARAAQYF